MSPFGGRGKVEAGGGGMWVDAVEAEAAEAKESC
jgi:hypothetical protein